MILEKYNFCFTSFGFVNIGTRVKALRNHATVYVCNIPHGHGLSQEQFGLHWARSCSYSREKLFILIFYL